MSTSRRLRRTAALSVVSALALGATAEAASAAPFDLTTGTQITSGRAHGSGSVAFTAPRTVKIAARIDDLCAAGRKGDGYGAYIEFRVNFVGGGSATTADRDIAGCTGAGKAVRLYKTFPRQVRDVRVTVFEGKDLGGGEIRVADTARTTVAP